MNFEFKKWPLSNLQVTIQASQNVDREERELVMELSPLLLQWRDESLQEGVQQGLQEGEKRGKRIMIENALRVRFGNLDEELSGIIERLLELPPEEIMVFALQLSREELLARFGS